METLAPITVTPVYAGLLGLVFLALTWRVITRRHETGTSLGDGGDRALNRRVRAHGNFAEFAPLGLVLLLTVELMGAPAIALHLAGSALVLGRAMHGLALTRETPSMVLRSGGMILTMLMIAATSLALVAHSLW